MPVRGVRTASYAASRYLGLLIDLPLARLEDAWRELAKEP